MHQKHLFRRATAMLAAVIAGASLLTACAPAESKTVTLATHDSFVISKELTADFKKQTGLTLKVVRVGDGGELVNKLILTQGTPIADAFFGIDNVSKGKAEAANVVAGGNEGFKAVDFGDVCFNYDTYWFRDHNKTAPANWLELTKPEFKNLTVLENPASSSTGLAFLAATVAELGESGYQTYWQELKKNGVKITAGWEDAYFTDFSGSSGKGAYPIVLSYSTSPAYEIREDGKSQTASLSDKCFRQTEYAGVLSNAKNPGNAKKLIDFLLADKFQSSIAESMYVYPAALYPEGIPADWAKFGQAAKSTVGENLDFEAGRQNWLEAWAAIFE